MNKFIKAGLLIVTLVIPALIFTFLQFFGTNHYDLPFYHPKMDLFGKVIVSNGDTVFYKVAAPQLKTIDNKEFPKEYLAGGLTIVSYLPRECGDSCQIVFSQLGRIYTLRHSISDLRLLTITENWPIDDNRYPEELGKEGWKIGVFSEVDRNSVLNQDFLFETKVPKAESDLAERKLILIDWEGHIRGYYTGTDSDEIDRLMAEIKILDYAKKNKV